MNKFTADVKKKAGILFDDIFGKGHGKEMTVSRFISVLEITESEAYELFDIIYNNKVSD